MARKLYKPASIRPLAHSLLSELRGELDINNIDIISFAIIGIFSLDKISRSKIIRSGQLICDVFNSPKEDLFLQAINEIEPSYVVIKRETFLNIARFLYEDKTGV